MNKLIFNFNSKDAKKIKSPKNTLGGKGANLSEMGRMGLPVPPGFTISTNVCDLFYKNKKKLLISLQIQLTLIFLIMNMKKHYLKKLMN